MDARIFMADHYLCQGGGGTVCVIKHTIFSWGGGGGYKTNRYFTKQIFVADITKYLILKHLIFGEGLATSVETNIFCV